MRSRLWQNGKPKQYRRSFPNGKDPRGPVHLRSLARPHFHSAEQRSQSATQLGQGQWLLFWLAIPAIKAACVFALIACDSCTAQEDPPLPTNTIIPYATVKRPPASISRREGLGFGPLIPLPREGVVLAGGSFLSSGASFTVVDFDARTLERLATTLDTLPDGQSELALTYRKVHPLSISELNRLIQEANRVWNPPPGQRSGSPIVTDSTCDIILFDGNDMLHQFGPACPYNTQKLVEALDSIVPYGK
jgi:hypothetical protein